MLEQKFNEEQNADGNSVSQPIAKPNVVRSAYYVPTIEELHIGFECELLFQSDNKLARTENYKWHPVSLDKNNFQKAHSLIKQNKIRVKYIDREDCLSLGWKERPSEEGRLMYFGELRDYDLQWCPNGKIRIIDNDLDETVFLGFVKNKSELKRVLQQIGCLQS